MEQTCTNLILLFIFVIGLIYYIKPKNKFEPLTNQKDDCPNMLIEKDGELVLFNSKKKVVPGVNPIIFKNLEEYKKYVELQQSKNTTCPVIYLQYTTDTQNNELLKVKSSIFENKLDLDKEKLIETTNKYDDEYFEKNKILDATKDSTPDPNYKFNTNMFSGFDQYNQDIGRNTPLDQLYYNKNKKSPNPMDPNWGGKKYTQQKIDQGEYKDRYVYKHTNKSN